MVLEHPDRILYRVKVKAGAPDIVPEYNQDPFILPYLLRLLP
jgi:hypothetical protein